MCDLCFFNFACFHCFSYNIKTSEIIAIVNTEQKKISKRIAILSYHSVRKDTSVEIKYMVSQHVILGDDDA